jgi:chromosome segregation ATPase
MVGEKDDTISKLRAELEDLHASLSECKLSSANSMEKVSKLENMKCDLQNKLEASHNENAKLTNDLQSKVVRRSYHSSSLFKLGAADIIDDYF